MTQTQLNDLRRRFRFFLEHSGYATPPGRAACALSLARAEIAFLSSDLAVEWEAEQEVDLGDHTYWCKQAEHLRECESAHRSSRYGDSCDHYPDGCAHEVETAVVRDGAGHVLAVLGNIIDPDTAYRRVIEAELASEALATIENR